VEDETGAEKESDADEDEKYEIIKARGNKTEVAMLKFAKQLHVDYIKYREKYLGVEYIRKPFSSQRKRMSTVVEKFGNAPTRMLLKGASEYVLKSCKYIHYWKTDEIKKITEKMRKQMEQGIKDMA
jgi:magnesium-transporting ATPase (P-type)